MKRIISFVLCLSMLVSMVPMQVFAADVDETTPVTEAVSETEAPAATDAPAADTTAAAEPETTGAAVETTAATEVPEVTEAATEEVTEPAQTESGETVEEDTYEEFTWIPDVELPGDEELFAGYVEKTFYGGISAFGTAAGDRLTGDTKLAYDAFRGLIEEIAAGERSSAEMTIGALSNADVSVNFSGSTIPAGLVNDLFYSLLADLPYEMYWFDKTMGVGGSYGTSGGELFVTLRFVVSPHYSADGSEGTFDLDTAKTGAAAAAAANARDIVDTYADQSDYEKLVAYRDEICKLTSYNNSAASSSYSGGYGDPWQLIWVFDGVTSTKVVCEGYSKAFQYLCDLSDFDADIVCYNVQGTMDGGGHMWNIVSINGSSYLVDVTNSEMGTVGYKDKLFLVGGVPNENGVYTFANCKFQYNDDMILQWGSGADSILTLAQSNFDPDSLTTPPQPDVPMTGEELLAAMESAEYGYSLSQPVVITSDITLPSGTSLYFREGAGITVMDGATLTLSAYVSFMDGADITVASGGTLIVKSSINLYYGASLTVEEGGTLTNNSSIYVNENTSMTVAGTLINNSGITVDGGTLDFSGTYEHSFNAVIRAYTPETISGMDTSKIALEVEVFSEEELVDVLRIAEDYASTSYVRISNPDSDEDGIYEPFTLTRSAVIPANTLLQIRIRDGQTAELILADGVTLTNNGSISIIADGSLTVLEGATLINNNRIINDGTLTVNGTFTDNGTFEGNAAIIPTALDRFLANVAAAEVSGENLAVWGEITLAEDLTINMTGELSFADYAKLVVPSGVTLTVNGPIAFNHSELVVEEGGRLVSNTNLSTSDYNRIGASITIDGELVSNGGIWVTDGAILNINGSAQAYREIHVGFGGNGVTCELNVNGSLTTYGYLNIVEATGALNVAEDAVLTIGGQLFDDEGNPYANGYLQAGGAVTVDGTLNVSGGLTLGSGAGAYLDITPTGKLNINNDCMWFDVMENGILTNEGTVQNHTILNNYGTILNYGTFHNNVQIRLFGTGTYDSENGTHYGSESVDGAAAQRNDFLNDLEDGQGANLFNTVTLAEDLTISLGEDQVVLHGGSELHVPNGVTLTVNSPVFVNEAALVVEEGGTLIVNTNVSVNSEGALGCVIVNGHMVINDGGTLWLDNGGSLEIYGDGVVDVKEDHATEQVAAIHVAHFSDGATVLVEGTLNTGGYVNVTPGGWFTLREGGTLNIMNNAEYGCGYLDVTGMAQLYGTVNQYGLMSASNGNGTDEFVPATARIEVYGTLNGSDTSAIFINPNASISVAPSGMLTTAGEVILEQLGTLWVDGDVTFTDSASVTSYGNVHVNHFPEDADYNGCLIIDGTMTNYGYMNIGRSGTLFVNGTLNISQTMVEDQGFAGYLNSFGYVIVNGTVNNSSLMDTDSPDGFGSLRINESGIVNVRDNIVMAVCDLGSMILDGTLNVFTGAYMEVYGEVSGSGSWVNNGTVHFGVYTDEETGEESVGSSSFGGWYTQSTDGVLEVELYEGEPISVDLTYSGNQTLVYSGGDMDAIRTVLGNGAYRTRVIVTEDMTMDEDVTIGIRGAMVIRSGVTIPENVTVTAYGPVIVEELDYDETAASLTVDGTLKLYHPNGTMTILENGIVTVNGYVLNGTSATVHGSLVINGRWEGYAPAAAEGGSITGEGAPSEYEMFLTLIREAGAGGYPAVLSFDLTIPQYTDLYCDLIVEEGVTLTLDGNLAVWGSLTVKPGAKLVNNEGLSREHTGAVTIAEGSYSGSGTVYNACMTADDYDLINGIPMNRQTLLVMMCTTEAAIRGALPLADGYESATLLVRHDITLEEDLTIPDTVTLRLYRETTEDGEIIPANFTVPEGVMVTNNGTFRVSEYGTLTINGSWVGNRPTADEGGTIAGDYTRLGIGIQTTVQPSFIENPGTADQAPGLWAGAKTSFYPTVLRIVDGEMMSASAVKVSFSEGAEDYAKIVQKDGLITITANSNLTSHQIITITFTAENADPCIVNMHLRPKASAADVLLNGEVVTGQTILADLNRGDTGFRLAPSGAPADAVPENGTLSNGGELITWKSSAPAIATVDENGTVTFTGEKTGKVKITMTANYGTKKTAVVTFNVVALPQEILASASNPTVLVGGTAGTFTATDAEGSVLKNTAVKWYLCDAQGEAISAHPYASITAAGKLTTKAVADDIKVWLMAQVIGDESSALLAEPVCVTLYPAINSVHIMAEEMSVNNMPLLYDIAENGMHYQLGWFAEPYMESVQSVSWKSSKAAVADIDQNGLITVASENASGTVKFTLTVVALGGKKSTATVTMKFGTFAKSLDLAVTLPDGTAGDLNDLTVYGGETLTFSGSCVPANVSTDGIVWSLSDKTYGTISNKGVLKTKAVNNPTVITVAAASKDGYCGYEISVTLMPKQVATGDGLMDALYICTDGLEEEYKYLTKATHAIMAGDAMQLYANAAVTWTSSNTAVAVVDADGVLTALADGTSVITATTADGRTASFNLKVTKMSVSVDITTKKGEPFTVVSGKSLDLVGIVTYSDGSTDKQVNWSADDTSIVTVKNGKLAAVKGLREAATVRVYADAKDGSSWGFVDVQVLPMTSAIEIFAPVGVGGINTDVSNTTVIWDMLDGTEFSLSTKVFPAGAAETVTWKSSSPKIAAIDENGNVECLKSGTVTITATAKDGSGKKATFKLTVKKTMEYLQLPETAFVGGGKSLTLTKLAGYNVDPLATNQNLNWVLTYPDGSAVPASVATLAKGILKTKAVTAPVTLLIRAEATDGSGLADDCTVTIFPVMKGVELYTVYGDIVSKKSVTVPVNEGYTILPDATNVPGFGYEDDGTADERVTAEQIWTITYSKAGIVEAAFDGQSITFYAVGNPVGKSVKITLKANDGSGKSAYFTISFT